MTPLTRSHFLITALTLTLAIGAATSTTAGVQGPGERQAQSHLPQSNAPLWTILRKTKIGQDSVRGVFTASFPPEVRALNGQEVALSGFILPLDTAIRTRHFLISRYTPVCFFCPPGEPNEVAEVMTKAGVRLTDRLVNVRGRLVLSDKGDKGLFFQIMAADAR